MKKSDIIAINGTELSFSNMGLFDCETAWQHPTVTIDSYEFVLVLCGNVFIREKGIDYSLKKGDLLLLDKEVEHGGFRRSNGHTSFYWLHFYCSDPSALHIPKLLSVDLPIAEKSMREIMHLQERSPLLAGLTLARFIAELNEPADAKNKIAFEIAEYIRINRHRPLSVEALAKRFGYVPDRLSRILKKEFGKNAKTMIDERRTEYLESLLINTDYTVAEIAEQAGFQSDNEFTKYFTYHEKITPTLFRNRFFRIHMNEK